MVARMPLQRFQALLLRLPIEMHPELEDQGAVVGEGPLERGNAREAPVERARPDAPVGAVQQGRGIPGAEEEPEAPARRQVAPVAPELGALPFLLGQPVIGVGDDSARIEPFREQVDRFPLARAVDAGEQHDGRKIRFGERALRLHQRDPERRCLFLERGLGNLPRPFALHLFEHATAHRRLPPRSISQRTRDTCRGLEAVLSAPRPVHALQRYYGPALIATEISGQPWMSSVCAQRAP